MLSDIIIYNGENIIDYKYEIDSKGKLVIKFNIPETMDKVNFIYDINVYDKIKIKDLKKKKVYEDELELIVKKNRDITIYLNVNYKFFVKSCYKFINRAGSKEDLINNLNLFKDTKVGKKYLNELSELVNNIDTPESKVKGFALDIENDRVDLLLFTNKLYENLASKMKFKDLMLLVVSVDGAFRPPKVNNIVFNCLLTNAMCFKRKHAYLLNLAKTYTAGGFDYSKLDDFFIKEKDTYYFKEYININCVDKDELINKLVNIGDKDFINELINDEEFLYKDKLKETIK